MKLSQNFTLAEMTHSQTASRLGLDNDPPAYIVSALKRTAEGLEQIRAIVNAPIIVSSGYRSPFVNRAVGGAQNSQHTLGEAADINAIGYSPDSLMRVIVNCGIDFDQCILEFFNKATGSGWVHVSFIAEPRKQALVIDHNGTRAYA